MSPNEIMILNLSGRGDKDVNQVQEMLGKQFLQLYIHHLFHFSAFFCHKAHDVAFD